MRFLWGAWLPVLLLLSVVATTTSGVVSLPTAAAAALGSQKLAVITVQFPDAPHDPSVFDPQRAFLILNEYYRLNSYGKMWWEISISPTWYTLPQTQSYYGPNPFTQGELAGHGEQFVVDALAAASGDLDLAQFSRAMIVYAKMGQGSTQWTYPLRDWNVGTRTFQLAVSVVSEGHEAIDQAGVPVVQRTIEHEAGHLLGLPDLYHCVDGNCFTIVWDGMGAGQGSCTCQPPPGGEGCICHPDAAMFSSWTKSRLGWIDDSHVKTIQAGQVETVMIDALGLPPTGVSVIKVPLTQEHYYLIEVREAVGADANLPLTANTRSGVFVLAVNETTVGGESGTGIVRWVNPQTQQAARNIEETSSAAFQVGASFSNSYVGSMTVLSKVGNSYQVRMDRSSVVVPTTATTTTTVTTTLTRTVCYVSPTFAISITVNTDKSTYLQGETVSIAGEWVATGPPLECGTTYWILLTRQPMFIVVTDYDAKVVHRASLLDANINFSPTLYYTSGGNFSTSFQAQYDWSPGKYSVTVYSGTYLGQASASFEIAADPNARVITVTTLTTYTTTIPELPTSVALILGLATLLVAIFIRRIGGQRG